jgi:hypothetical protein
MFFTIRERFHELVTIARFQGWIEEQRIGASEKSRAPLIAADEE